MENELRDAVLDLDAVRVALHVLSVSVWVGGQIVLAAIVPVLRRHNRESMQMVARAFQRVAWPAFGLALITGFWGMLAVSDDVSSGWSQLIGIKILVVLLSGVAAYWHQHSNAQVIKAVAAAGALITALAALLMGAMLSG